MLRDVLGSPLKRSHALIGLGFLLLFGVTPSLSSAAVILHEYKFNGSVTDSVGTVDGALFGDAYISNGALHVDGVGDYAELSGKIIPTDGSAFSVTFSAKQLSNQPGYREIISQGQSGGPGFYIGHTPGGNLRISDNFSSTTVPFPNDGEFHDFALVVSNLSVEFFIDGSSVFLATGANLFPLGASGSNTRFGTQFSTFPEYFHGIIDNVRVYDGALAQDELPLSIPLPGALELFLAGLIGIGWLQRRRSQH